MEWTQALTIIGITVAFFIYMMSRMDGKHKEINEKLDSNQKQNNEKFDGINQRFNTLENRMTGMEAELKGTNQRIDNTNQRLSDFRTDVNQRLSTIEGYLVPRKVFRFEEPDHKDEPKEN